MLDNPIINTFSAHSLIKSEGAAAAGSQHAERGLGWKRYLPDLINRRK